MPATENLLETHCRRIREVYPNLQLESARLLPADEGQYNDLVVVNERLVFRFPRFVEGVARLSRLARILSLVRGHVTLSTPEPRYLALDPPEVGRAFLGYPLILGQPLRTDTLESLVERGDASTLRHLATQLAGFLKQLHGISPSAVEEALPGETAQFRPLAEWEDLTTASHGCCSRTCARMPAPPSPPASSSFSPMPPTGMSSPPSSTATSVPATGSTTQMRGR